MIGISRQILSWTLCIALALVTTPLDSGAAVLFQGEVAGSGADYSGRGMPLTEDQLQALVAPIALYPDPLVAQILDASTYPDQVVAANNWLQQNKNLAGGAMMNAVNNQDWDPSVKALTQFPAVLNNLAQNLIWTSELGDAYHNQQSAVTTAIQLMRGKAKAAGNLKTTEQMTVTQPSPDIVVLEPATSQVVYVPQYSLGVVYGTKVQTPSYNASYLDTTGAIAFGPGIAVGVAAGGCCDWIWSSWSADWYHGSAVYRGFPYYGNNAWHGGYYGGTNNYGNHGYYNAYDYNHPNGTSQTGSAVPRPASNAPPGNREGAALWDKASGGWVNSEDARGWGKSGPSDTLTAFSSWDNRPGISTFGSGGWGDRSSSYRGWTTRGGGGGWGALKWSGFRG